MINCFLGKGINHVNFKGYVKDFYSSSPQRVSSSVDSGKAADLTSIIRGLQKEDIFEKSVPSEENGNSGHIKFTIDKKTFNERLSDLRDKNQCGIRTNNYTSNPYLEVYDSFSGKDRECTVTTTPDEISFTYSTPGGETCKWTRYKEEDKNEEYTKHTKDSLSGSFDFEDQREKLNEAIEGDSKSINPLFKNIIISLDYSREEKRTLKWCEKHPDEPIAQEISKTIENIKIIEKATNPSWGLPSNILREWKIAGNEQNEIAKKALESETPQETFLNRLKWDEFNAQLRKSTENPDITRPLSFITARAEKDPKNDKNMKIKLKFVKTMADVPADYNSSTLSLRFLESPTRQMDLERPELTVDYLDKDKMTKINEWLKQSLQEYTDNRTEKEKSEEAIKLFPPPKKSKSGD